MTLAQPRCPSDGSPDLAELLGDARRRHVLSTVQEADAPVSVADLVRRIVERERAAPLSAVDDEHVEDCYIVLYHGHGPKLADAGLVEFDVARRSVELEEPTPTDRAISPGTAPAIRG